MRARINGGFELKKNAITKVQVVILAVVIVVAATAGGYYYYLSTLKPPVEPIKIGFLVNLSSPPYGEGRYGLFMAVDEINAAGGILGRPVEVIVEDHKGELTLASAAYRKLVTEDKVLCVIDCNPSAISFPLQQLGAELYPSFRHIFFSSAALTSELRYNFLDNYDKYKFWFSPCPWSVYYARPEVMEQYWELFKMIGVKKIAFLYEDRPPGWDALIYGEPRLGYKSFKEDAIEAGFDVVYESLIDINTKEWLPILDKCAASGAEFINFGCSSAIDFVSLAKQWAISTAKDIPLLVSGTGVAGYSAYWDMTGGDCLGMFTVIPAMVKVPVNEKTIKFWDALYKKYGKEAQWNTYFLYDAVYMLKLAIEKAGNAEDVEAIIKALEKVEFVGVYGNCYFDKAHNFPYYEKGGYGAYYMCQWQGKGDCPVITPPDIVAKTNPGRSYIPPAELRKGT